ncbi:MAG: hypothetical protein KIT22_08740, partial [Verrucomicrobiae bacterium]|nr:hypothetical protein [Verrucomicrobiae bacterium]
EGWIEVTSGLEAGDAIVRQPAGLRTGDPVHVGTEEVAPASVVPPEPPPASLPAASGKNS